MTDLELINLAVEARKKSYSPYSGFAVGAALLGKSGKGKRSRKIIQAIYSKRSLRKIGKGDGFS